FLERGVRSVINKLIPSPPLEMLPHFSPLAPFFLNKRDFALCGGRPKGYPPSGHLTSCAQLDQLL
ncbi:MAG: hypothetical protein IJ368_06155, partial [Oscillospiraceae bacterium]|nr:hypothetical protein [Oscillospiraceae bacterium]